MKACTPHGVTDYINIEDRLRVEIIPDGVHVHPILLEKTLRCKRIERVAFITDSLKGSGNPRAVTRVSSRRARGGNGGPRHPQDLG